ncbi:MAG: diguanylate cyclase [Neisseria sp.]|nr:diguanylate cyclase [Neisseria sp.]
MLESFVLGFWIIWSSNRDIHALSEGIGFILLAVIIRGFMSMSMPVADNVWVAAILLQWVYVVVVFGIVNRFSESFSSTMVFAAAGAMGFFWLTNNANTLVESYVK